MTARLIGFKSDDWQKLIDIELKLGVNEKLLSKWPLQATNSYPFAGCAARS